MTEHQWLQERIELLEFHQKLLLKLVNNPKLELYKLIIENGITSSEMDKFYQLCDELSIKLEKQKAEGYVYFHPLFNEFSKALPAKLSIQEIIKACVIQELYVPLFQELVKYV